MAAKSEHERIVTLETQIGDVSASLSSLTEAVGTIKQSLGGGDVAIGSRFDVALEALGGTAIECLTLVLNADEPPPQPCGTAFTTEGTSTNRNYRKAFKSAYAIAQLLATTICSAPSCSKVAFKRYAAGSSAQFDASQDPGTWTVKVVVEWECQRTVF